MIPTTVKRLIATVLTKFQSRNRETYDSNSVQKCPMILSFSFSFNLVIEKLMIPTIPTCGGSAAYCSSFNLVIEKLMIPTSHFIDEDNSILASFNLVIEKLMIPTIPLCPLAKGGREMFQSRNRETYDSNYSSFILKESA